MYINYNKYYQPVISYVFFILNVIVFLIEIYIKNVYGPVVYNSFLDYYGISVDSIVNGNIFLAFLFSPFLHAGFLHIAFNMLFLLDLGPKIESKIGYLDFFLLYIFGMVLSDFFAAINIIVFHKNIIVIGASGALFALFSFYATYFYGKKGIKGFIIFFILYHLIMISLFKINIAMSAHLGGSLAGFIYYYFFFFKKNVLIKETQQED